MTRPCPVCGGKGERQVFPYRTTWNGKTFQYIECRGCGSTYVDPSPTELDFQKMYSKVNYHNEHYSECSVKNYRKSTSLLRSQVENVTTLLDFGCGNGAFLAAAKEDGFTATGVEFDSETILFASENSGCPVFTLNEIMERGEKFEVIHLGDVLEHLPDPASLFKELESLLVDNGVFFVEGPLENNPSPVLFSARLFGWAKKNIKAGAGGTHAPTHLLRVSESAQRNFFMRRLGYREHYFSVSETGWPYLLPDGSTGLLKNMIGRFAVLLSGVRLGPIVFGNRFYAICKPEPIEK